jgi:NADPH-dependent glutamate synthase beta subunit-like oxidoreductase/dihydroorotate dehydrogenase/Pyruvate/2-oxoacid:ferredoxin oxidoreductase delta subunit
MARDLYLTEAQLKSEMQRCEFCEEKPCRNSCPAGVSPADFIMAAKLAQPVDIKRAAGEIMKQNPLGGVCGLVCPDRFCLKACVHQDFDYPVNIPALQATIIKKAKELGGLPKLTLEPSKGIRVAIIGAGPAGLAAAAFLTQKGYEITIFEAESYVGGMANLIPHHRLEPEVLRTDLDFIASLGNIELKNNHKVTAPQTLLEQGYKAVVAATGLEEAYKLGIPNENLAISALAYLKNPSAYKFNGKVAVVGGGATAADAAVTAKLKGAQAVEIFALENWSEMPLTARERDELKEYDIEITGRIKVTAILAQDSKITGIATKKVKLAEGKTFNLKDLSDLPGSEQIRNDIEHIIVAIGACSCFMKVQHPAIFYAGDCCTGPSTVVEAVANGKNVAQQVDAYLTGQEQPVINNPLKCEAPLSGYNPYPVPLETDFFGRTIKSPFLLSAAPPSDGLEQMEKAYQAGWAGGVMKTSFAKGPIHIPGEYMHAFTEDTYGNCDNVSGHLLDRVCREIEILVRKYPDRLTMASTGGPVTGDDTYDQAGWQANTKRLEAAGAMAIEYSLSCPQGGDGTEGDIVSQNPALTAKIIDWVMEVSDPEIPKLFKLTAAVTSIAVIINAIKKVLAQYPHKKAGVTLANTFPTLIFRAGEKKAWEEGIIVGMSGAGVLPISYLTLASVGNLGVTVSGNGGPMDYKAAANFLALGAKTVQFCTVVMKQGYDIIYHLESGLSYLLQERGLKSVKELIGIALPKPIRDFMELTPVKKISSVDKDLCKKCGNCSRCPYLAITMDEEGYPVTDPAKCIGCSICVQKCFAGALAMRERTPEEAAALKEG